MIPEQASTIVNWLDNSDLSYTNKDGEPFVNFTLPERLLEVLKVHLLSISSPAPSALHEDPHDLECPQCEHEFEARPWYDLECPKCGLRFTWDCSQGHDHVESCTPVWENEDEGKEKDA